MGLPEPYYDKGGITVYHGDARHILPFLPQVDLLLTDPPYAVGWDKRNQWGSSNKGKAKDYGKQEWDAEVPPSWLLDQMIANAKWSVVWGGNYFQLPPTKCVLVWDKDNTGDFADCELAWTNLDKAVRKIKWRWNGMLQELGGDKKETRVHPTQKPLAVMKWAIQQAPADCETILDPFAGSLTTARAAKDLGKRCICIEREEKYIKAGIERLRQEVLPLGA